jgi:hypothetical protein
MFPFCNARRKGGLKQKDPNRAQPPYPYICPPISAGTLVGDANVPLLCALLRQKLPAYLDLMLPIVRKRRRKRSSKGRRNLNLAPIPPCVNAPSLVRKIYTSRMLLTCAAVTQYTHG